MSHYVVSPIRNTCSEMSFIVLFHGQCHCSHHLTHLLQYSRHQRVIWAPTLIVLPEKGICLLCHVSPWIHSLTTLWTWLTQVGTDQKVLRICLLNFLISLQLIVSVDTFSSPGSTSLSDVMFVPPYLKSSNSTMWRSWEIRLCLIEISNLYTIFPLFLNMWRFFKQISDIIFIEATTDQWNEKCWNLFKC